MEHQVEGGKKMDHKTNVIVALSFVVVVLIAFVGINAYNNKQEEIYDQGLQNGALLQQRSILQSVQTTGYFTMNMVDETGQPVSVILAPVRPQQEAGQQ